MSSPSLPNRDSACKSPVSMNDKVSPFLAGLSENKMCGYHNPHDVTCLVCVYTDTSVTTYQTDGKIRTSSKKIRFFYDTSSKYIILFLVTVQSLCMQQRQPQLVYSLFSTRCRESRTGFSESPNDRKIEENPTEITNSIKQ